MARIYNFISLHKKTPGNLCLHKYPAYLNGLYHTDKGKTVKHLAVNIDLNFLNFEYDVLKLKQKILVDHTSPAMSIMK